MAFTFFKPTKLEDGKLSGQAIHKGDHRRADPRCRTGGGRMPGDQHRRAGRPPHRRRRGRRGACGKADHRAPGRRDPRNEGARRQRLLRRLIPACRPDTVKRGSPCSKRSNWPAEGNARVPYRMFSDPEIYRAELDRIFLGPTWQYLALAGELPRAGRLPDDLPRRDAGHRHPRARTARSTRWSTAAPIAATSSA